jgi:UDP-glucuronate decarboxylase
MMSFFINNDIEEIIHNSQEELQILAGRKILLAGGGGFLGRYFNKVVYDFNLSQAKKIHLTSVDNFISSSKVLSESLFKADSLNFVEGDISDKNFVTSLGEFDFIINAAGIASPYHYRSKPLETLDVSVLGTRNLLELAKIQNNKFTFFSSSEIYGDPDPKHIPIQESYRGNVSTIGPRACYDESKRLGETLCYIYKQYFGTYTNIIRPFNVYGPGMQEADYRVMPNFASKIKSEKNLKLYGSAKQTRTYCYITDAMSGFLKVITKGLSGEPYNIGNPEPEISVLDLADIFIELSNSKSAKDIINYPDSYPADEPMRRCPDIKKAIVQLGYQPSIQLKEGVSRYLSWSNINYTGNG